MISLTSFIIRRVLFPFSSFWRVLQVLQSSVGFIIIILLFFFRVSPWSISCDSYGITFPSGSCTVNGNQGRKQ
jgi:hypothetical protein